MRCGWPSWPRSRWSRPRSCRPSRCGRCGTWPGPASTWSRTVPGSSSGFQKLLEDALIKISSVLTDVHGASGRAMLEALIAGQRDPKLLAELARGRARARRTELEAARSGRFTDHHARLARLLLNQIDELGRHIEAVTALLDEAIAALPTPAPHPTGGGTADAGTASGSTADTGPAGYASAVERLCQIPG